MIDIKHKIVLEVRTIIHTENCLQVESSTKRVDTFHQKKTPKPVPIQSIPDHSIGIRFIAMSCRDKHVSSNLLCLVRINCILQDMLHSCA